MSVTKSQAQLKTAADKEKKRVFFLDNLKIGLVCLVVANHASQAYTSINTGWVIVENNIPTINNWIIGTFLSFNNAFFMALFFLISAYFLPASFDRKGPSKYLKDRLIRLGLPTAFFVLLVIPLLSMAMSGTPKLDFGHTWFLALLLIFSGAYAAYRIAKPPAPAGGKLKVPGNAAILAGAVLLTLALFATRIVFAPGEWMPFHLFEPARLPAYVAMFLAGIVAYRNDWINRIPVSTGRIWGLVAAAAVLATPAVIFWFGNGQDLWAEGPTLASLAVSAWDAFLCVSLCVCLPVLFRERLDFRGKVLKAMADDSFAVYLLHPFVLIVIQAAILGTGIHPFVKFILVTVAGIALSYWVAHLVRKIPCVGRVI